MYRGRACAVSVVCIACLALMMLASAALASRPLSVGERQDIARSMLVSAPNGTGSLPWPCIGGYLSTVDADFALVTLTNTPACVARFGGATGGGRVIERHSLTSRAWYDTGVSVSDACSHSQRVSDAVLRDLGCTEFVPPACVIYDSRYHRSYSLTSLAGAVPCATMQRVFRDYLIEGKGAIVSPASGGRSNVSVDGWLCAGPYQGYYGCTRKIRRIQAQSG